MSPLASGRHKRHLVLLPGMAFIALSGAIMALGKAPSFLAHFHGYRTEIGLAVRDIRISGLVLADESTVFEAIGPIEGLPINHVDIGALAARLRDISWVRRAEVTRRLPDRIEIHIEERKPYALWQRDGHLVLIDREGAVLTDRDLARWRDLPLIVGEGAPEAAPLMLDLLAAYPDLLAETEALIRVGERRWDLKLGNGVLMRLPAEAKPGASEAYGPDEALARFVDLERRYSLLGRDIAILDLRLADRLTIRMTRDGRALMLGEEKST